MPVMTERIRLIIDTDYRRRQAVRLRALKTGQTTSDVLNALIDENLDAELREVDDSFTAPPPDRKKPGRKPKGDK